MEDPTLALMKILHPQKCAIFIDGLAKAGLGLESTQGWHGLPVDMVQGQIVEPVLVGLGFGPDRREPFDHDTGANEMALWLATGDHRVALLITDTLETDYTRGEDATATIDGRHSVLRTVFSERSGGFAGRIVFTNGRNWRMYLPFEAYGFPAIDFSLDSPGGFWDLFMLSMTQADVESGNR